MRKLLLATLVAAGLLAAPAMAVPVVAIQPRSSGATTTTDRSITITTGGTAQQVMAANVSRRSFYVFNPNASGTCWASLTTTTPVANGLGSFPIAALGGFGMEASASSNAIYVNCPTTGQFISAWESQ